MSWLALPVLYVATGGVGVLSGWVAYYWCELRDLRAANGGDRIGP